MIWGLLSALPLGFERACSLQSVSAKSFGQFAASGRGSDAIDVHPLRVQGQRILHRHHILVSDQEPQSDHDDAVPGFRIMKKAYQTCVFDSAKTLIYLSLVWWKPRTQMLPQLCESRVTPKDKLRLNEANHPDRMNIWPKLS